MPKVALVANEDWGLYNYRRPLARALKEHGCEVLLICPPGRYSLKLSDLGYRVIDWNLRRGSVNAARELRAVAQLAGIYRRENPDAVHHFALKPILYGSMAALIARVPAVINTFTGLGFAFFDRRSGRRLLGILRPWLRFLLRRRNSTTLFHTAADKNLFFQLGLIDRRRSGVIPGSGVDTRTFYPAPTAVMRDPVVLMAARLLYDKGIGEFVEAARILRKQGLRARFWVAGSLDPENPSCVPGRVLEQWRSEQIVEFLGHREDMPELLRQADIAVLPSYSEGVPRFLLEAAATGLPIVASDIDGCRTVARKNNAFLVPPRDSNNLAQAIARLVQDPELRMRMGLAAREIASIELSEERIVEKNLGVYAQYRSVQIYRARGGIGTTSKNPT